MVNLLKSLSTLYFFFFFFCLNFFFFFFYLFVHKILGGIVNSPDTNEKQSYLALHC